MHYVIYVVNIDRIQGPSAQKPHLFRFRSIAAVHDRFRLRDLWGNSHARPAPPTRPRPGSRDRDWL